MRADVAAVAAGLGWFAPAAAPVARPVARLFGLPCTLAGVDGVALTFDDGPHPEGTPAVLAALAASNARATFFLVGEQVERDRGLAREIVDSGHTIGIHGYRHTLLLRRSPRAIRDDLVRARDVIGAATGTEPCLYRPPYGVFSGPALLIVRRLGWRPLLWSRWGRDWVSSTTPQQIAARASSGLRRGDVVLLHDADHYSSVGSWRRTAAALPAVLASATASRLALVSASQSM